MNIVQTIQTRIKNLSAIDIACIKISAAAFALFVVKAYPSILVLSWYWFIIIALVVAIKPIITLSK